MPLKHSTYSSVIYRVRNSLIKLSDIGTQDFTVEIKSIPVQEHPTRFEDVSGKRYLKKDLGAVVLTTSETRPEFRGYCTQEQLDETVSAVTASLQNHLLVWSERFALLIQAAKNPVKIYE